MTHNQKLHVGEISRKPLKLIRLNVIKNTSLRFLVPLNRKEVYCNNRVYT